ncbi:MAG: hypothetical protein CM15mP45_16270 [Deltaproteobacteria bacterium]|nr:MAG: hypothetical protein CM15mP45_16270 [Deltaproteobacteria bacterium]
MVTMATGIMDWFPWCDGNNGTSGFRSRWFVELWGPFLMVTMVLQVLLVLMVTTVL